MRLSLVGLEGCWLTARAKVVRHSLLQFVSFFTLPGFLFVDGALLVCRGARREEHKPIFLPIGGGSFDSTCPCQALLCVCAEEYSCTLAYYKCSTSYAVLAQSIVKAVPFRLTPTAESEAD